MNNRIEGEFCMYVWLVSNRVDASWRWFSHVGNKNITGQSVCVLGGLLFSVCMLYILFIVVGTTEC